MARRRNAGRQGTLEAALSAFQDGRAEDTALLCARILEAKPRQPSALHLLGVAYLTLGQPEDAAETLAKAAQADAGNPEIHANLGAALRAAGKAEDAVNSLRRALALSPGFFNACFNLANALAELGRHADAKDAFEKALGIEPRHQGAHNNFGLTLEAMGETGAAAASYRAALATANHLDAHRNLARLLRERAAPADSLPHCEAACAMAPEDAECHNQRGVVLNTLERTDDALEAFRRALEIDPGLADAHVNCGNLLSARGDTEDAIRHFRNALEIDGLSADVIANMALAQQHRGDLATAAETYRQALSIDAAHAEARFGLGVVGLLEGSFAAGWQGYLARESMRDADPGFCREPLPAKLTGKRVLVVHDQGIGDDIFFLRFADRLRDRGARVSYLPDPRLARMFTRARIADIIDEALKSDFDLKLSVCDLPALLGMTTARDIPPSIRLVPEPEREAGLRDRLAAFGAPPYIGVTWRAGTRARQHLLYKATPKERIAAALAPVEARIIALQRRPEDGEVAEFARMLGRDVLDLTAMNSDLEDMLALVGLLDDQVCVSNTNVHLAATRGRTCRLLIPHPPEFRWMARGDESPWFPGMRVYRQAPDGDWEGAMDDLARELTQTYAARQYPPSQLDAGHPQVSSGTRARKQEQP